MFLLIPVDIIEKTPEIKHFLETGERKDSTKRMQAMLQDNKAKTERLLQAAADAVIIFNSGTLQVETFNAAAESMFG